jgi:hypothetical protein
VDNQTEPAANQAGAGDGADISDFLHTRPETASGEFVLPMVTVTLRALRR